MPAKIKPNRRTKAQKQYEMLLRRIIREIQNEYIKELKAALGTQPGLKTDAFISPHIQAAIGRAEAALARALDRDSLIRRILPHAVALRNYTVRKVSRELAITPSGKYQGELWEWANKNAEYITNAARQETAKIADAVAKGVTEGQSQKAIAAEIARRTGIQGRRAAFIARDQAATLVSQLTKQKFSDAGVQYFEWSTSNDERVRPEHEALNGQIFRVDSPPDEGFPGTAINCRCAAIAVLQDS